MQECNGMKENLKKEKQIPLKTPSKVTARERIAEVEKVED